MFILCSDLSLGTTPVTFLPRQLPLLGAMKLVMSLGSAWEAAPFPLHLGRDFGKVPARHIMMDFVVQKKKMWLFDPTSRVLCWSPAKPGKVPWVYLNLSDPIVLTTEIDFFLPSWCIK